MPEPHPLYVYGPYGFIAVSTIASAWLAPRVRRRLERWIARRGARSPIQLDADDVVMVEGVAVSAVHVFRRSPERSPLLLSLASILLAMGSLWGGATLLALALLALPTPDDGAALPGERVDATVLAHVVPTTALASADALIERLERGGGATRWSPQGALEARLVLAGRVDPRPARAVERLAARGYRTRAGLFAITNPTDASCARGLDALAEAVRGGSLQSLMRACRNAAGDHAARAAFKMGDFMRATGEEAESIVSRLPRAPAAEPSCIAGGFDLPGPEAPLCRLLHAELVPTTRAEVLAELPEEPPVARRYRLALRAERGAPFDASLIGTIDPVLLVERPIAALVDEPLGVYVSLRDSTRANLRPREAAWIRLALAAERSAVGRDRDALWLVDEAYGELALGAGSDEVRALAPLAVAIAVRAGAQALASHLAEPIDDAHPIRAWLGDAPPTAGVVWAEALRAGEAAPLVDALSAERGATEGGLRRFAAASDAQREVLAEWLREAFPACEGCGFHAQLDRLAVRLDGARALGDRELVEDLEPVLMRFEAVLTNRLLGLSLRLAEPDALAGPEAGGP